MLRSIPGALVALSCGLSPASAQTGDGAETVDDNRLKWRDGWRRVGVAEYTSTALLGAGILALHWVDRANEAHWDGPIVHDDWMRDTLRISSRSGRSDAATVSDVLDFVALGHLFLVDNLAVTAIGDSNADVAWQMFVINVQSYALSSFANRLTKRLAQRARPYVEPCRRDSEVDDRCGTLSAYESFYSGHATSTATSAGLICAHHTHLALYGGGAADVATCLAAVGFTTATGALRIASDNHWATDVLVGHVSGYLAGYLLPTLVYYGEVRTEPLDDTGAGVRAMGFVLPRGDGVELGILGVF
jgi:membrane-associated phospholipid phosphatase